MHNVNLENKLNFHFITEFVVQSPFDIIHSDLWTSHIPSLSGIKYYVLFLDHLSHFLWVYPLHWKYDASSKFLHFREYVHTQFKYEIRAF